MSHEQPPRTPDPAHENPQTLPVSRRVAEHPPRAHHPKDEAATRAEEVRKELCAEEDDHGAEEHGGEHGHGEHEPTHTKTNTSKEALKAGWSGVKWAAGMGIKALGAFISFWHKFFRFDYVSEEDHKPKASSHGGGHGHGGGSGHH